MKLWRVWWWWWCWWLKVDFHRTVAMDLRGNFLITRLPTFLQWVWYLEYLVLWGIIIFPPLSIFWSNLDVWTCFEPVMLVILRLPPEGNIRVFLDILNKLPLFPRNLAYQSRNLVICVSTIYGYAETCMHFWCNVMVFSYWGTCSATRASPRSRYYSIIEWDLIICVFQKTSISRSPPHLTFIAPGQAWLTGVIDRGNLIIWLRLYDAHWPIIHEHSLRRRR